LSQYDSNNPFGDNYNGGNDDDAAADDGNYGGGDGGYEDLPLCEQGNNGYIGLGCSDDGTFSIQYFSDAYCLEPTGTTYDKLQSLNRALKNYKSCAGIWYNDGDGGGSSLPYYLVSSANTCSAMDSGFCVDNSAMKERRSHTSSKLARNFGSGKSWVTKLKYATGGLLLLASFVMFTGILFTNRRRRRALMQRKYRQSRGDRSRRKRSKSSKSSRKSSRSRSKARTSSKQADGDGVFA